MIHSKRSVAALYAARVSKQIQNAYSSKGTQFPADSSVPALQLESPYLAKQGTSFPNNTPTQNRINPTFQQLELDLPLAGYNPPPSETHHSRINRKDRFLRISRPSRVVQKAFFTNLYLFKKKNNLEIAHSAASKVFNHKTMQLNETTPKRPSHRLGVSNPAAESNKDVGTMFEKAAIRDYKHSEFPTSRPTHNKVNGAFDLCVGKNTLIEVKSTQLLKDNSEGLPFRKYHLKGLLGGKVEGKNQWNYEKGNSIDFWYAIIRPFMDRDPSSEADIDLFSEKSPYHHYLIHRKDLLYLLLTRKTTHNPYANDSKGAQKEALSLSSLPIELYRQRATELRLSNELTQRWRETNPILSKDTPHEGKHPSFELIRDYQFTPAQIRRILHNQNPEETYNNLLINKGLNRNWVKAEISTPSRFDDRSGLLLF